MAETSPKHIGESPGGVPNTPGDLQPANGETGRPAGIPLGSHFVEVPVVRQIGVRNRIIEIPEIHVVERVQPKIQIQEVIREVPKVKTVFREKIVEVPQVEIVDKIVHVPQVQEVIRHVPKTVIHEVVKEVPVEVVKYVEKIVEVPQIEYVEKYVEVPHIRHVVREVPKIEVVEIPVEVVRHVPKREVKKVEKIRHVPGPVQYHDIPYDVAVPHEVFDVVEKIVEVPVDQEVIVEKPVAKTVEGPTIEVPYEVIKVVEKVRYQDVPGKVVTKEVPFDVEQVEEIQVPEFHEVTRVVPRQRIIPVERLHEVEVPHYVEEVVEVPDYVYVPEPPLVIIPKNVEEHKELPDIYEIAGPRFVHDPVETLPAIYDDSSCALPPIFQNVAPRSSSTVACGDPITTVAPTENVSVCHPRGANKSKASPKRKK
eukprot:CAMPEP_0113846218 /NCGR_PEP_ID=MMETSP0372-20130328/1187_1 /TAXON_ID=340204 /ORGANISM="Lankesteria abbotti" /LENGTH=424 /DNA_ID=CAMNT_0000815341 /DNA_START=1123 /DNA_END=2397 /DNA_ORIENTATION=+ /assembly_acc=CAM_ASM_000359